MGNNYQERSIGPDFHPGANGKQASRAAVPTVGFPRRDGWAGLVKTYINIDEYHSLVSICTTMEATARLELNGLAGAITARRNSHHSPVPDHFLPTINVEEAFFAILFNSFMACAFVFQDFAALFIA